MFLLRRMNRGMASACMAGLAALGATGCSQPVDVLPRSALGALSLRSGERPRGYHLLTDTNVLGGLGMTTNPDYVSRVAEMETVAVRGGMTSFLVLYGRTNEVRLMLNGVYFRQREKLDAFAAAQQSQPRRVAAFRLETPDGLWLLLAACDPDQEYADEEREQLHRGLERYAKRLKLDSLFDKLGAAPAP